jgi:hypothetical protein
MTIKLSRLVSGRVPVTTAANVTADRYQFIGLSSTEPNLGTSGLGNVLTTDTVGSRIWTNNLSINNIDLTKDKPTFTEYMMLQNRQVEIINLMKVIMEERGINFIATALENVQGDA